MLFNSLEFVAFFVVVFLLYWKLGHRQQNLLLLGASLLFYGAWNWRFLWLIGFSALLDYLCGLAMEKSESKSTRKRILLISLTANLGLLGTFKYAGFFVENLYSLLQGLGLDVSRPVLNIALPVGISFYTFQTLSYTIDIYRGQQQACRSFRDFLLYVSFFPQLVAGPIERSRRLLPQVLAPRPRLGTGDVVEGLKLILLGYLQKVAIADTLAPFVDHIYKESATLDSLALLLGLYAFAIQAYGDFSGYSKIARGTARLLGFRLMVNFRTPFLSRNFTQFWRRWHISLSTWLRDYLYIPLGGNRFGTFRTYLNLMITMLVAGFWHGADWNFVLFGILHGISLSVHRAHTIRRGARPVSNRFRWGWVLVTFHLNCLYLILFRAPDMPAAWTYLKGLLHFTAVWSPEYWEVLFYLALVFVMDQFLERRGERRLAYLFSRKWVLETCLMAVMVLMILFLGENHVVPFVYFQF